MEEGLDLARNLVMEEVLNLARNLNASFHDVKWAANEVAVWLMAYL